MILSGLEIEKRLGRDIVIDPFDRKQLGPNSYNLRLGSVIFTYDSMSLDMRKDNDGKMTVIPNEGLMVHPGIVYLARTLEYTETFNLVPMIEGRSSVGRLGIFVHTTAGFGDVGFKGCWTLEISCIQPAVIYPGVEICQLFFHTIEGEHENYRSNKYQNSKGLQRSLMYKDFK